MKPIDYHKHIIHSIWNKRTDDDFRIIIKRSLRKLKEIRDHGAPCQAFSGWTRTIF